MNHAITSCSHTRKIQDEGGTNEYKMSKGPSFFLPHLYIEIKQESKNSELNNWSSLNSVFSI